MKQFVFTRFLQSVLLGATFLLAALHVSAQCTAPTAIGTPTVVNASCPGNGQITIGSMTPSAASISPDIYQYALYDTTGTTVIAPYQSSNTLVNIAAGTYTIYVRRVCSTGFSTPITRRVTVNNTEISPVISQITLNRAAQCNNGRFTVTAKGSGPLQYAFVNSLTAPEPPSSYVRAPQSSNIFDSLAAGTYFVRVYNACGNAVTQSFNVPSYTTTASFSTPDFFALGCDSFHFRLSPRNFINIFNTVDTAQSRLWVVWPSGSVDTLRPNNTVALGSSGSSISIIKHLEEIDPLYNSTATFYEAFSNYPYVFKYGYKDICGNIVLDSFTLYEPTQKQLVMAVNETDPLSNCDSVAYRFRIQITRSGLSPGQVWFHAFRNSHNFMYSIDSGASWQNARSSNSVSSTGSGNYSDYIQFLRGVPIELRVAYCGDTLNHVFTPASQPGLNSTANNSPTFSCIGFGGILFSKQNANGDTLGFEMLNAPPGQVIVPYFTRFVGNLSGGSGVNLPQYQNLIPGTYTIRVWDSFGVECPRFVDRIVNVQPFNFDFSFEELCNGILRISQAIPNTIPSSQMRVRILDSVGNPLLGPYGSSGSPVTANIPASAIQALPDGNYIVRVYKSISGFPNLDSCTIIDKIWTKIPNLLSLAPSRFVPGCPGGTGTIVGVAQGGRAPYTFTLRDASSAIVAPSTPGGSIYNNLSPNATYTLQVVDSCGTVENRTMSIGGDLAVFVQNTSTMPCPNDDVTLAVDNMPGVGYQWYKNGVAVPGATNYNLFLPNIQNPADSGRYQVEVSMGGCVVMVNGLLLDPDSCGVPLPVTFSYFAAIKDANSVHLKWTTESEINNKGFVIEHSNNGSTWTNIGFVKSLSDGKHATFKQNYQFEDNRPLPAKNFYRLKQLDTDGKHAYSEVRMVDFSNLTQHNISIYPNPVADQLYIDGLETAYQLRITNQLGQTVLTEMLNGAQNTVNVSQLSQGVYFVTLSNQNQTVSFKIVK